MLFEIIHPIIAYSRGVSGCIPLCLPHYQHLASSHRCTLSPLSPCLFQFRLLKSNQFAFHSGMLR